MSRGNPKFAEYGFKKGDGRGGRPKGAPNKTTRALKEAIILAAEKSKHSKAHDLEGYLLYLADEKPELFVPMLGKLLPLQVQGEERGCRSSQPQPQPQHVVVRDDQQLRASNKIDPQSAQGTGAPNDRAGLGHPANAGIRSKGGALQDKGWVQSICSAASALGAVQAPPFSEFLSTIIMGQVPPVAPQKGKAKAPIWFASAR